MSLTPLLHCSVVPVGTGNQASFECPYDKVGEDLKKYVFVANLEAESIKLPATIDLNGNSRVRAQTLHRTTPKPWQLPRPWGEHFREIPLRAQSQKCNG